MTQLPMASKATCDLEGLEIELLLEGVYRRYRLDFRNYSAVSLRRRVRSLVREEGFSSISALQERVLHDREWLERLVHVRNHAPRGRRPAPRKIAPRDRAKNRVAGVAQPSRRVGPPLRA